MRILCLDFGLKRIGVAVNYDRLAEPLEIIDAESDVMVRLVQLVREYQIDRIVIGLSEGQMAAMTQDFGQKISRQLHISVEYIDETLSSQEVESLRANSPMRLSKRKMPQDHLVAAHLLQQYLDYHLKT